MFSPLLLALAAAPNPAAAPRPFTCDDAMEVVDEALGDLNERPLRARICTAPEGDQMRALIRVNWEAPMGEDEVWQTLLDTTTTADAGAYTVVLRGAELTLAWSSGASFDPQDQLTRMTWRWNPGTRQFGELVSVTSSAWADGRAAIDKALSKGDIREASAQIAALGATPNGGRTWFDDELYLSLLRGVEAQGRKLHMLRRDKEAAALVLDVLARPPITAPYATPKADQWVLCGDLSARCEGEGHFNDLPIDTDTANLLVACAFYLERGEQDAAAVSLLSQVLDRFPTSADVHRSMGDALWDLGRLDEARVSYRRYLELRPGATPSKAIKKRLKT